MMLQIKTDIKVVHLSLHILALTIGFDYPERFYHMIALLIPDYHKDIFHQNCFD